MKEAAYGEQVTARTRQIMEEMLKRGVNSMWSGTGFGKTRAEGPGGDNISKSLPPPCTSREKP